MNLLRSLAVRRRLARGAAFLLVLSCATAADRPNVLFIAIDDLRSDLGALGVEHARTPQLDRIAGSSRLFSHHFVQTPTCGASRCALLRGRYPLEPAYRVNTAIRDTQAQWGARSLPAWLRRHGYTTLALGKITHYPGGMAGENWNEPPEELPGAWTRAWIPDAPWRNAEAMMHGYADGRPRVRGESPPWESAERDDAYPDAWVAAEAVRQLRALAGSEEPWFLAVGFFKPHLPWAAPRRWHEEHAESEPRIPAVAPDAREGPGWSASNELFNNYNHDGRDPRDDEAYALELRRAYAAAVSYMDAQIGRVMDAFESLGMAEDTILVVWSDHGFLVGEHDIWGKHTLYDGALRSPLMIRHPDMPARGAISAAIVETVDVYPTILDLCGLPAPDGLDGASLRPQLEDAGAPASKPALSYWREGRSVRTERWRMITHPGAGADTPRVELFDLTDDPGERRNVAASHPEVVRDLTIRLNAPDRKSGAAF